MHIKGSRHQAAEARLKERELVRQNEINKRIALSDCSIDSAKRSIPPGPRMYVSKPLIEQTRKAASDMVCNKTAQQHATIGNKDFNFSRGPSISIDDGPPNRNNAFSLAIEAAADTVVQKQSDFQALRERELKFTAAGWKRNGHGSWFRDENAEFDSDEEDPNVCLA